MQRPALLRFDSDTFMDDLAALLDDEPARLGRRSRRRRGATGRRPAGAPTRLRAAARPRSSSSSRSTATSTSSPPRWSAGSPGLPDHDGRARRSEERVGFVLRRLDGDGRELAWSTTGARLGRRGTTADDARAGEGEELLPLFPLAVPARRAPPRGCSSGSSRPPARESSKSGRAASRSRPRPRRPRGARDPDPRLDARSTARVVDPLGCARRRRTDRPRRRRRRADARSRPRGSCCSTSPTSCSTHVAGAVGRPSTARRPAPAGRRRRALPAAATTPSADRATASPGSARSGARGAERERIWGDDRPAPPDLRRRPRARRDRHPRRAPRHALADALPAAATLDQARRPSRRRRRRSSTRAPGVRYVVRCVYLRPHCGPLHPTCVSEPTRAVRDRAVLRPRRAGAADPHRAADRHLDRRPAQVAARTSAS